jgi:hypothetical protein
MRGSSPVPSPSAISMVRSGVALARSLMRFQIVATAES